MPDLAFPQLAICDFWVNSCAQTSDENKRLKNSITTTLKIGEGAITVINNDNNDIKFYSQHLTGMVLRKEISKR